MTWKEEARAKALEMLSKATALNTPEKQRRHLNDNNPYADPNYKRPWRELVKELTSSARVSVRRLGATREEEEWLRKQGL